ncbi:hypothetical protein E0H73_25135 [Kribbella pittospori]|uniref:Uncharacterized protein n=1 Tax=Kribbella pittospori TaxID=722689 RepID=A0A4R0KE21_9ACTN|nr:hypothetical protein [Kribbella pittospori]TCC58613.1 hypothetical protein E0H73_25135 [Kribbella pittospori]
MTTLAVEKQVRRPRATLWALRITLLLHAALAIGQPIFAGYFLSGDVDAINTHAAIGGTIWMVAMIQIVVAILYWRPGGGRFWPTWLTALLFFAEFAQAIFGYQQNFSFHVPLGTAIVISIVWMAVWSFRPTARLSRQEAKK